MAPFGVSDRRAFGDEGQFHVVIHLAIVPNLPFLVAISRDGWGVFGRWSSLVKVFNFDLSLLARFHRIVSFFVLGLVLLLVSFSYQRRPAETQAARK